jgi:hypothetical protein
MGQRVVSPNQPSGAAESGETGAVRRVSLVTAKTIKQSAVILPSPEKNIMLVRKREKRKY